MKYNFELSDVESVNAMNTIERVANRLIDIALVSSKMADLNNEIKTLKESVQRVREERNETRNDIRTLRKEIEYVTEKQNRIEETKK